MQRENVTQERLLAWIFSHYSTAVTICPRPNGSVDMKKKRKKKQNEENAGLNVANADEKGKTKSYYKSYFCSMHCILVVVRIRMAWAAVSLFARPVARPWRLKVELNSIFLRLIGVMLVLKEMNFAFQLGLHRSVCDGLISESFQMLAWFQTQQTRVLMLTVCITDAWS